MRRLITGTALLLLTTGCGQGDTPAPEATVPTAANGMETATTTTDAWIGRWNGPEGLFLDIAPEGATGSGRYALTIRADLDTQARFAGRATGERIRFTRDGAEQMMRAGSGSETGFKWLAEKRDCLIVVSGREGYCRD